MKWLLSNQDHAMPKNFVRKTFDRWLAHNHARFRYPPRLVLQRKQYIELQFLGITPAIRCAISTEGMVGIYASYQGEWWDSLAKFDVVARRTSPGQYYCGLCTSPEMFASRGALWVTHSFEPLLAWTNAHFQASQWLLVVSNGRDDVGGTETDRGHAHHRDRRRSGVCLSRRSQETIPDPRGLVG